MALLSGLLNKVKGFTTALSGIIDIVTRIKDHFFGTFDAGKELFDSIVGEIAEFKNWKENLGFKNRVINLNRAITKTSELIQGAFDAGRSVVDLVKSISLKVEVGGAAEVVEAASGIGLPVALVNAAVLIVEVLDTIRRIIDDAQTIVDEVTRLRNAIENLDVVFLGQSNPRQTVALADGGNIKIRVGGLHPTQL